MPTPDNFYRRPLPQAQVAFASTEGRALFQQALAAGGMEGWFALSEQFHTQSDPAFCGLGTLVTVLNALEIDPGRVWKGPWRWFGEELLDCCLPLSRIRERGVTLDELACLARCNGAAARVARADTTPLDELRVLLASAAAAPRGPFVVAAYSRAPLGQTGAGHYSPLAGYHAARDLALVLDVARFKYPPHWVALSELYRAMQEVDPQTGRARGFLVLERSPLPLALLFRLRLEAGPARMQALAFETLPRLLALPDRSTQLRGVLDGPTRAALVEWGTRLSSSLAELPAEHAALVDALLCELRATALYALVRDLPLDLSEPLLAELLTVLLLALPDSAVSSGSELAQARARLRDAGTGALAREILALREQLAMLRSWTGHC